MEERQTGGKADEWGFFQWDERVQHVEEGKKAEDGRREEGLCSAGEGPERSLQTLVIPLLLV